MDRNLEAPVTCVACCDNTKFCQHLYKCVNSAGIEFADQTNTIHYLGPLKTAELAKTCQRKINSQSKLSLDANKAAVSHQGTRTNYHSSPVKEDRVESSRGKLNDLTNVSSETNEAVTTNQHQNKYYFPEAAVTTAKICKGNVKPHTQVSSHVNHMAEVGCGLQNSFDRQCGPKLPFILNSLDRIHQNVASLTIDQSFGPSESSLFLSGKPSQGKRRHRKPYNNNYQPTVKEVMVNSPEGKIGTITNQHQSDSSSHFPTAIKAATMNISQGQINHTIPSTPKQPLYHSFITMDTETQPWAVIPEGSYQQSPTPINTPVRSDHSILGGLLLKGRNVAAAQDAVQWTPSLTPHTCLDTPPEGCTNQLQMINEAMDLMGDTYDAIFTRLLHGNVDVVTGNVKMIDVQQYDTTAIPSEIGVSPNILFDDQTTQHQAVHYARHDYEMPNGLQHIPNPQPSKDENNTMIDTNRHVSSDDISQLDVTSTKYINHMIDDLLSLEYDSYTGHFQ